nr:recombinase family protein [Citrobacter freundii]
MILRAGRDIMSKTFGYIRVSSKDQNEARQVEALKGLCDDLMIDK